MAIDRPDMCRVTANQLIGTAPIVNVFHFHRVGGSVATLSDVNTLLDQLCAAADAVGSLGNLFKERDAETGFVSVEAQTYALPFPVVSERPYSSLGEIVTGADLPDFTAYRIDWSTGLGGKWFKGRTFVGGLAASQIGADGNTLVATTTAQVQVRIDAFVNYWALNAVWEFSVFSKTRASAVPPEPIAHAEIQSGLIAPTVRSMVSRKL